MAEEKETLTKEEKKKAKKDVKKGLKSMGKAAGGLLAEFKAFISKGNVVDMAIGVVIGAAFSAIITAVVNGIIMPIITLAVPSGGIDGLVTVLNHSAALVQGTPEANRTVISYWGNQYYADTVNVINWGAIINAVIYFLAVALILFIILKVFTTLKAQREKLEAIKLEKHYEKHPEDRPVVKEEVKGPTQEELLQQILDELKSKKK